MHGEVAGREDVGAPFGEQQVDFRRPAADTLDLGQQRDRLLVVLGQVFEIELTRHDQLGEAADVAGFLARHASGAHFLVAGAAAA